MTTCGSTPGSNGEAGSQMEVRLFIHGIVQAGSVYIAKLAVSYGGLSLFDQNWIATILAHFKHHYAVCHDRILTAVKGTNFRAGETLEDAQYRWTLNCLCGSSLGQRTSGTNGWTRQLSQNDHEELAEKRRC